MKWYWILLIAIVALIIGYLIGRQQALAKALAFNKALDANIGSILNELSTFSGGGRVSSADATLKSKLVSQRDALLRIKNPSPTSANLLVVDSSGKLWNGWTYVPTPAGILTGGAKCRAEGNYWIFDGATGKYICATSQNPY